jgi:hypothetical protein
LKNGVAGVETRRRKGKQGSGMSANELYRWRMDKRVASLGVGWYQKDAAAWYGVSERQWRRWENGEVPIPTTVVKRIAEYEAMRQVLAHAHIVSTLPLPEDPRGEDHMPPLP